MLHTRCRAAGPLLWAALSCLALPRASADILHTKKGEVIEGRVQKDGDTYSVETKKSKMTFPADMVDKVVEKKTDVDTFYERSEALADNNAAGHAELGQWCLSQRMPRHATLEFRKALTTDPKCLPARVGLASLKADAARKDLKKMSPAAARAMVKKMKAIGIRKLYLDIQPRPNSESIPELSGAESTLKTGLAAKGYDLAGSAEDADATYRVLYKTGLSGSYEIEGRKHTGHNVQAEAALLDKKGKTIWKGEVYGFTGAKVKLREGADIESALRTAAIEDFQGALSRALPMNAEALTRRLSASASFPKGGLKKMCADLDSLLVDLEKDQIAEYDVLGCYGYPAKEEIGENGVKRWIYEEVGLVFEWREAGGDIVYSYAEMGAGYPGTLYGIQVGQPLGKVKEAFECKLVGENEDAKTGEFVVTPMAGIKGAVKVVGGENQTVEAIRIEFGRPPKEGPEARPPDKG